MTQQSIIYRRVFLSCLCMTVCRWSSTHVMLGTVSGLAVAVPLWSAHAVQPFFVVLLMILCYVDRVAWASHRKWARIFEWWSATEQTAARFLPRYWTQQSCVGGILGSTSSYRGSGGHSCKSVGNNHSQPQKVKHHHCMLLLRVVSLFVYVCWRDQRGLRFTYSFGVFYDLPVTE
jgi:hypothetical protein